MKIYWSGYAICGACGGQMMQHGRGVSRTGHVVLMCALYRCRRHGKKVRVKMPRAEVR